MIVVDTGHGPQHFSKVVFVWAGYQVTGWAADPYKYVYNDDLNGVLCKCEDDPQVVSILWRILGGTVPADQANVISSAHGYHDFRCRYGNCLIVAVNRKPDQPVIEMWAESNMVVDPAVFELTPFDASTNSKQAFSEYVDNAIAHINSRDWVIPRQI